MSRTIVLVGCWPHRMCADLAAVYCGQPDLAEDSMLLVSAAGETYSARRKCFDAEWSAQKLAG